MQRRSWALVAAVLASGTVFLDSSFVNVALKAIGATLPTSIVGVLEGESYVVNAYLLTLSALLILAGALADRYGRRLMFIIGLIGFGATSALCGLAPSMELLIVFRLAQGFFGAVLVPTSLAIITATFEGAERGRAFGIWAAASGATSIAGPVLGGILVDTISWRVAFLINAPIVIVTVYLAVTNIDESRNPDAPTRFDWIGAAAVALAVGGLTFGGIRGQQSQWRDPSAIGALVIGAVLTLALVPLMTRRRDPLIPPGLFRSRNFTVTNLSTMLIYGAIYTYGQFQAIFLQTIGYSALASGLVTLPSAILLTLFSTQVGTLAARRGPRVFMTVGPALMAAGLLWFVRLPAESTAWTATLGSPRTLLPPAATLVDLLPGLLLFGIGLAIMVAPLTTALMTSVPARNSGLASAINNALSRIGPLLAGAVIFIAVSASFYGALGGRLPGLAVESAAVRERFPPLNPPVSSPARRPTPAELVAVREASTEAFHLAMLLGAALCAAGSAANGFGIRNRPS